NDIRPSDVHVVPFPDVLRKFFNEEQWNERMIVGLDTPIAANAEFSNQLKTVVPIVVHTNAKCIVRDMGVVEEFVDVHPERKEMLAQRGASNARGKPDYDFVAKALEWRRRPFEQCFVMIDKPVPIQLQQNFFA